MIKFNGNNINKWLKGTSQVNKVYKGEVSCYPDITNDAPTPPTPTGQTPTFAVIQDIQTYTATTYCKVYDIETNKWYMLNNLNQYEEYGIYDVSGSSLTDYTTYEGKLAVIGTTEYQYSGGSWVTVGTYEDTEVTYAIDRSDQYKYSGQTISTTFKILMSELGTLTLTVYDENSKQLRASRTSYSYRISPIEYGTVTNDGTYYYFSLPTTQSILISRTTLSNNGTVNVITGSKQISVQYQELDAPYGAVSFSSMTDASNYADVYYGLPAKIEGDTYVYTTANTWNSLTVQEGDYLRLNALSNTQFGFDNKASSGTMYVSYDWGNTWINSSAKLNVQSGNTVMCKGTLTPSNSGIGRFSSTGSFNVEGNIMSLLYGDNYSNQTSLSGKDNAFRNLFSGCALLTTVPTDLLSGITLSTSCYANMFQGCSSLTTAPSLPATTLSDGCYSGMFKNCTSLTTAPQLPATTLTQSCYFEMFYGCTSLTTAPVLSSTTLADSCYLYMFNGCTSLTTAPQLPATTLAYRCYQNMFSVCTSLTTAPTLSATTLAEACYRSMFQGCTSLTTAPQLLATTLTSQCYLGMFAECSSLNAVTCLATDISASQCTYSWLNGVAANGTFTKAASMSYWSSDENGIPYGWVIQDYQG